jgi:asparagine synthase (glutamine-hydrolysing)
VCGIFGAINPSGITYEDGSTVDRLGRHLLHRGPDGSGSLTAPNAYLGMNRLSIMDVENGAQPFWSENQQFGVLGNGEIYNANELRLQLIRQGHTFHSTSDIEVIPHLLEIHGLKAIDQLRGMFALAILDKGTDSVHLVRDRLGEKPINYYQKGNVTYFSSEQSALVKSGLVEFQIDATQLPTYLLHGYTPEPHSLITGIKKVPAGSILSIRLQDGAIDIKSYWNPMDYVGFETLVPEVLTMKIQNALKVSCTSDVPVGISLSGGLDSSIVAAIAAAERTELHAFTVGYAASGFDESTDAQNFAKYLGIPCHLITLDSSEVAKSFSEICSWRDEPIADIAGPSMAAVARKAHEAGVPVLLTGLGGDELFWGYEWINNLASWTTKYLDRGKSTSLRNYFSPPPSTRQGLADWLFNYGGIKNERSRVQFMKEWETENEIALPLFEFQYGHRRTQAAIREICGLAPMPEFIVPKSPELVDAFFTTAQLSSYLRVNGLTQVDRLSMQYSVESRVPLSDHVLVEYVMSTRLGSHDSDKPAKSTLREAAKNMLPAEVLQRPKRGFTPPVREWLKLIWMQNQDALDADSLSHIPGIDIKAVRKHLERPTLKSGQVNQIGLRLLTLEFWARSLETRKD